MSSFWYLRIRMIRERKYVIALCLFSAAVISVLLFFQGFVNQKELEIADTYREILVYCEVSDLRGTKTDNLRMPEKYIRCFYPDDKLGLAGNADLPVWEYVSDIRLKSTIYYGYVIDEQMENAGKLPLEQQIAAITCLDTAKELGEVSGVEVIWFGDYTEEVFGGDENVCLVSENLFQTLTENDDGNYSLSLFAQAYPSDTEASFLELNVAGIYSGTSETIYCPWRLAVTQLHSLNKMIMADSLSFDVRDNTKIGELKELLSQLFSEIDFSGKRSEGENVFGEEYDYAVAIHDGTLRNSLFNLNSHMKTTEYLYFLVTCISIIVEFSVSFIYLQNRKKELTILWLIGTKKSAILWMTVLELAIANALGIMILLCVYKGLTYNAYLIGNLSISAGKIPWFRIGGAIAMSLLGGIAGVSVLNRRDRSQSIKEED